MKLEKQEICKNEVNSKPRNLRVTEQPAKTSAPPENQIESKSITKAKYS